MSLYVYCVLPPSFIASSMNTLAGIQNQPICMIEVESLPVWVSSFVGTELLPTKENIFIHERVVESCMDQVTPLPFRFGVVVSEEKLKSFFQANLPILKADLAKVEGCVEMGVKVMLHPASPHPATSGTEFLQAKRQAQDIQRDTTAWVNDAVVGLFRHAEFGLVQGTASVIVRIAHLVPRDHLHEYKSHIDALVSQRTDCRFLRSGPWPPYSFISTPRVD